MRTGQGTSTHLKSTIAHSCSVRGCVSSACQACQVYDLFERFGAQQTGVYAHAGYAELHPRAYIGRQVIEENHLLLAAEA